MLGLEPVNLELNGHEAVQSAMEEEKVEGKIAATHLQRILRPHKAEVPAQLDQKLFEATDQTPMQPRLVVFGGELEKLDHITVLEDIGRRRVRLSHHRRHPGRREHRPLKQRCLELPLQLALAPALLNRHFQVELALLGALGLPENDEVVGPRQLCHQRCHHFVAAVRLVKLPHPKQVASREPLQARLGAGQISGKLVHHPVAPLSRGDLAADVLADLPIQCNQLRVDGLQGLPTRVQDQLPHFDKAPVHGTRDIVERHERDVLLHERVPAFSRPSRSPSASFSMARTTAASSSIRSASRNSASSRPKVPSA